MVVLLLPLALGPGARAFEVDATGEVYRVVDGDTIDVASLGRVRLADIDTPERGQAGYQEAADYTSSLVLGRRAYLDIDDLHGTDRYGRWVCVVYVRHNSTHLLNVNEALLERGLAALDDFPNEFNPRAWTLYLYSPANASTQPPDGGGAGGPTAGGIAPLVLGLALGIGLGLAAVAAIAWARGRRGRGPHGR